MIRQKPIRKLDEFAKDLHDILKSDRDVFIATAGMTGEGKSVAMIKLLTAYSKIAGVPFTMDHLTWNREELLKWIDGERDNKSMQKPRYSALLPDELISMFYKRNWYEDDQKGAIELFNKCRDRRLLVAGNVPNFFDLDSGLMSRFRFYIFIPKRGIMWVFKQDNNPFAADKWNLAENRKVFRKHLNPVNCPNFLCEILYDDLDKDTKELYYDVRNRKRLNTENQNKKPKFERYAGIKRQRNNLIKFIFNDPRFKKVKVLELVEYTGLSTTQIGAIKNGVE